MNFWEKLAYSFGSMGSSQRAHLSTESHQAISWNDFLPIPPIDSAQKYVVFQPHSDDAVFYAGGLLLKLAKAGKDVTLVTMTDGRLGSTDVSMTPERLVAIRRDEDQKAGEAIGVHKHLYLPFHDGELPRGGETTAAMVRIIRQEKPDAILAPDPWLMYEAHQDHLNCGWSAEESMIYCKLPLYLPELPPHDVRYIAFYSTSRPNQVVDIKAEQPQLLAALGLYRSQFTPETLEEARQYLNLKGLKLGSAHGMRLAEAFKVLTPSHLHTTNVDSEFF
ncbi:PIG-L deacetylase family protein [Candidatus Cryosericum septentrionale]|jgi:LmbE family N-acetylglucosaminyl deacetylase|uniref:PIG-L family deacetylase n=1 Tax=Candidatus Cryosericum septentrionale TaxID=2290913 RepID=A0A398DNM6_9BACT|nr:PIG-L family deacetylase [Candidatus Cryosericum septentrionale]RIE17222.1 PIG-L family deacetylase [Candidatus Cryosericum septentrionale]